MRIRTFNFRQALIVDFQDLCCAAKKEGNTIYVQLVKNIFAYREYVRYGGETAELRQRLQLAEPFLSAAVTFLLAVYEPLESQIVAAGDMSDEAVKKQFEEIIKDSRSVEHSLGP